MSEMIIERVGQSSEDPLRDCRLLKAGSVIAICPDGWPWSVEERNNPNWVIIRTPMSVEEAQDLIEQEEGDHLLNPLLQSRRAKLDFNLFPNGIAARLRASRASERAPIEIGVNSMRVAKVPIPPRPNPLVAR